jgi:hypothetical protein
MWLTCKQVAAVAANQTHRKEKLLQTNNLFLVGRKNLLIIELCQQKYTAVLILHCREENSSDSSRSRLKESSSFHLRSSNQKPVPVAAIIFSNQSHHTSCSPFCHLLLVT